MNENYTYSEEFKDDIVSENGLDLGNNIVMFFNEESNCMTNSQLRRLLYKYRIKTRKDHLLFLDKVKKDIPWIKYAYPEVQKYINRNLFVDLSYYISIFFSNNTWRLRKGLNLFSEFMNRLLDTKKLSSYKSKTIVIPVLDWDFNHDGMIWNFRKNINPISCIYDMMLNEQDVLLRKAFGDTDVIFLANDKYFKLNFSQISKKDLKHLSVKFKLFCIKLCNGEEFDIEDIDTEAEVKDSPEAIQNSIIDKVEKAKGVDLTAKVAVASVNYKKAKAKTTEKDYDMLPNTVVQLKKTVKIDKASKSKDVDDVDDVDIDAIMNDLENQNNGRTQEEEDLLAQAIAQASEDNSSEEEAIDSMDTEEIKRIITNLGTDDKVDITPARAARMSELTKELEDKEVNGKTVKELLSGDEKTEPIVTKLDIASPNDEWKELKFTNFDKNYDIDKDIVRIFNHFSTCDRPIVIRDIHVEDSSTSEDHTVLYNVDMEDYKGRRYNIKLDIPIMEDNRFLLRGNYKTIETQFFNMPIIKTEPDTCQLISNYKKIFLSRYNTSSGRSTPIVGRIIKALNKYKGSEIKVTTGYNLKISNRYELPIDYLDLSSVYSYIETKQAKFFFNQDEIRTKYTCDLSKGVPVGIYKRPADKDDNIIYLKKDESFDVLLLDYLVMDSSFAKIFDSCPRAASGTYSIATIMNTSIPVIVILGYHIGLRNALDRAKITYDIMDKLPNDIRKSYMKDWIRFSDGYIVYDNSYDANLLMNGLKACPTDTFSLADIDSKNMYLELLDNFGGRVKADGLDNFKDLFVDPMIKDTLKYYKMPTDYIDILLYGNSMLGDNKFIKHSDTISRRLRRYQLIAVYTYLVLSSAYGVWTNMTKHSSNRAEFSVKRSAVIDMFLTDNITGDDSIGNALGAIEANNAITAKGPSGMNTDRAYTADKRAYDDSMVNVLGMSTGFAGNSGVTRQTTIEPKVTPDGYVENTEDEMNDANTMTATENTVPLMSTHDDPIRVAMSFVQTSKHSVRTEDGDPLLVTTGFDEVIPYMTTNKFAYKAKMDGKILELTDEYILVEYADGSKDMILLTETIEKVSDGGYYVPLKLSAMDKLKVGQKIHKDQILAYDKLSFSNSVGETDNIAYNPGKLAKVAIVNTDEGFEDSGIISNKLANKLATRINYKYEAIVDKDSTIFSIAKVGDHIEAAQDLLIWSDSLDDEDSIDVLNGLADANTYSDLGKRKLKSEVTGVLKSIKIMRTVELEDLSESVRKVVEDYETPIKNMAKIANANGISKYKLPPYYKLPATGKLKKSQEAIYIEFYVEYLDTVGVGDKVVYAAANKAVEKNIFPEGEEPYTEFRPNEKIDAFVSEVSIDKRLVTSIPVYGSLQKLMIELDRSVKDILGIKYDDTTV